MTHVICLDIDGTLTDGIGGPALAGAREALALLRRRFAVRFVTNATSVSGAQLARHLDTLGLREQSETVYSPWWSARRVLTERGHQSGILIFDGEPHEDLSWYTRDPDGPAVLLASEAHRLTIGELQPAFRRLRDGASLYTLERNRYYRHGGELVTDLGPVAAFLEYASGRSAENLGKPSALLFDGIAADCGIERGNLVMVGDDAEFDVAGPVGLGIRGVLVRTGKYHAGDEERVQPRPDAVIESVAELPTLLEPVE